MPRRKPLPDTTPLDLTPREAGALDRLLDAYTRTEISDPGISDLRSIRRKLPGLAQDHTLYVAPTRQAREPVRHHPARPAKLVTPPGCIRLSATQLELLTDIATKPIMYIDTYMKWHKTAQSLIRLGLAEQVDCHSYRQYGLRITDAGRAEAVRRGILPAPAKARPEEPGDA